MTENMIQLQEENIILDIEARSKDGVLKELAGTLHKHCTNVNIEDLYQVLRDRDKICTTGMGNGVAILAGKIKEPVQILICFSLSKNCIGFE